MHYNWLNFLVNLQLTATSAMDENDYNWLNFLVNLQPFQAGRWLRRDYNWLNFLVNLQLKRQYQKKN